MQFRLAASTTLVAFVLGACGSSSDGDDTTHGSGASAGTTAMNGSGGTSLAGATATGSGGTLGVAGNGTASGGASPGDTSGSGNGSGGAGGVPSGAAGKSAMDSGAGGMPADGGRGAFGSGGRGGRASTAAGGTGVGMAGRGASGMGGAGAGGSSTGGMGFAGATSCPGNGHITYTLQQDANPTADEQNAYALITTAMDRAIQYYDCYTNITKAENVSYVPSVSTADGNFNGSIRFGGTDYMEYITAMHEIAHTVGIGTDSHWPALVVNGIFTGEHATAQLRAITGNPTDQLNADTQHFWPYGLNYTSEVKSEADLVDHCEMVVAIRWDMGYEPQ
jgi:hypothetical protein